MGKPGKPFTVFVTLKGYFASHDPEASEARETPQQEEPSKDQPRKKRPGKRHNVSEWTGDQVQEGEVFWDTKGKQISFELGDPKIPYGLWKAIQEMRKGERSLIMVKPAYGYDFEDTKELVHFPEGFEKQCKVRRAFFDVTLHDWVVKHDLLGDQSIIKTIKERGIGFDRPERYTEVTFNIKVQQTDVVLIE